ncbi:MAG: ParB N-terminal domain-containing protein [Myxococcaceae bacterium]|nr:ParB N-terminal domain-containing protein [Myxococcaceae bacterium]
MAKKAATVKKPARRPRRKKVAAGSRGLAPAEVAQPGDDGQALAALIREDGGQSLAVYRDPIGGHSVVFAALPIDKVEPTPYQRDLSEPHVKRLANAIERLDRYLDPVIAVRVDGRYWTPNGNHRLHASKLLGGRTLMALVMPEEDVAYQILALNTEKAHNLKERSLEVIRMYRGLVAARGGKESDYVGLFEEPAFITLGAAYEKRPRFSASAYHPIVKRLDRFLDEDIGEALQIREERADKLLAFDDKVVAAVDALKAKGFVSPYLKNFVIARINFLRFKKGDEFDFDEIVDELTAKAARFNVDSVKKEDIARAGGGPPAEAEE